MTKVEEVARAMEPSAFATYDRGFTAMNAIEQRSFLNAEKVVRSARRKALAAIRALREPSDELLMASNPDNPFGGLKIRDAYAAVIDAILAEHEV